MTRDARITEVRAALAYCARPEHLRRTVRIALVVGLLLTVINQATVIASGAATVATWIRCVLNFAVPFVVSNLGLLGGRTRDAPGPDRSTTT